MQVSDNNDEDRLFKFKDLKVYSSTEWLADNKKKYRQVFDRHEVKYIYTELSFYNKAFDKESWDLDVTLKCFQLKKTKKQICSLDFKKKISKFDNIVYIREGWGNKKVSAFWKKGVYFWEAWIHDKKIATKYFYIEDSGSDWINEGENPFVNLHSVKLYEGQYDDVNEEEREYMKTFSFDETRYIYADIELENNNLEHEWHCEIFVKFYNESRELKGQITKLVKVPKDEDMIYLTAGWGSNAQGSWRMGMYSAEIVFMNTLLAVVPFEVAEEFEEGLAPVQFPDRATNHLILEDEHSNKTFEELMESLDKLVGLEEVKEKIKDHALYLKFLKLRQEKGIEEGPLQYIHSVFRGNPGTGKTTVAKMMGSLYKKMGLLTKGHVHTVDRVDLVGEYIGQTAPKVKDAITKARGGVLFIDEAYSLARVNDDSKDFGKEVIEILVREMSNGEGDLAVIVAGYPDQMQYFIDSNPGLKSRFKHFFEFRDYLPQELSKIALVASEEKGVVLTPEAKSRIDLMIVEAYRNRNQNFGNARFVYDLIEKVKIQLALRIMSQKGDGEEASVDDLTIAIQEDIDRINQDKGRSIANIPVDLELLEMAKAELDDLIGMKEIKNQINEIIEIVLYHKRSGKNVLNNYFLHTVFIGNPGTGKTTVARILTKIYKALGLLERGHMTETDRQGLVAGYIGQTATKTAKKIDEAMGGVLFIDEAYALTNKSTMGDFGNEAIQTLLKRMEDDRGKFFLFVAGYPTNMEGFLKANPGLFSRFDKILKFKDYSPQDLTDISNKLILDNGYSISSAAQEYLSSSLLDLHQKRDKFFGNAREVRKIIHELIKSQNLRIAKLQENELQRIDIHQITLDDIQKLDMFKDEGIFENKQIGFRARD